MIVLIYLYFLFRSYAFIEHFLDALALSVATFGRMYKEIKPYYNIFLKIVIA